MLTPQTSGYRMQKNEASYLPGRIVAVDTETLPEPDPKYKSVLNHRFRLGHLVSGHYRRGKVENIKERAFTDADVFWSTVDAISGRRHTTWVVAHSALFDLVTAGLRELLESGRYSLDSPRSPRGKDESGKDCAADKALLVIDGSPFMLCLRCEATGGRIIFVDTLNWFKSSLAEIGYSLGLPKLRFPEFTESDETWAEYCRRDALITFEAFTRLAAWHRDNDLGVFRYTAASQAMGAYRHRFATRPIFFHDNGPCKMLERAGFFGGRTECYRVGVVSEPVYQLDVNSLYPSVMRGNPYPYVLEAFEGSNIQRAIPTGIDWSSCVAEVELAGPPPIYPFRTKDVTFYPTGSFRTTLCGPELYHAVTNGHVATMGRYAIYKTADLFTPFVDFFWGLRAKYRDEGNAVYANLAKIILNSLFGKFAQRSYRWEELPRRLAGLSLCQWYEYDAIARKAIEYRAVAGRVFKQVEAGERDDTLIAISGFVASYGRMRMNELRALAGKSNVFYQGVDSLLTNEAGYCKLGAANELSPNLLGSFKVAYQSDSATIYNCADYKIGSREVVAGRPNKAQHAENGKMIARRMDAVQSLFDPDKGDCMIEKIIEWQRTGEYRKGSVGPGGWVSPLSL